MHHDGRSSGYGTTGSSTPLAHSTTYPPYQDYPQTYHHRSTAPPPPTYDMRSYPHPSHHPHRHDSRQYTDDARLQRASNSAPYPSQSSNSTSYHPHSASYRPPSSSSTPYHHQGPSYTHPPHGHHISPSTSSSGPVAIPGSGSGHRSEKETPSPDSPSQRQRTVSLGTSSASTGTMLSSSSASVSNRRGYNLTPIRDAGAEPSRRDVFKDGRGDSGGDDMRSNRLPPIQFPFDDTDEEKKGHHVLLPPVKSLSPMSVPFPGSTTPGTPAIRSPMDSGRWYPIASGSSSNTNLSSPVIKSSPPDSRPKSLSHRTPPPPPTTNVLPSIPNHVPMPRGAFSAPFWDAVHRVWRLRIMDGPSACLPPVGNQIEWDGRWILNSGTTAAEGAPFAYWSVEQEAWALSS
jgi:hypothetical protein